MLSQAIFHSAYRLTGFSNTALLIPGYFTGKMHFLTSNQQHQNPKIYSCYPMAINLLTIPPHL